MVSNTESQVVSKNTAVVAHFWSTMGQVVQLQHQNHYCSYGQKHFNKQTVSTGCGPDLTKNVCFFLTTLFLRVFKKNIAVLETSIHYGKNAAKREDDVKYA